MKTRQLKGRHGLCLSHPDYHLPEELEAGADFDGPTYVKRFKDSGADGVVFFASCHYGHAYYPSETNPVHPKLKKDMVGEFLKGCREHDVQAIIYLSVFLNTIAVREHPEWEIQAIKNVTDAGFDSGRYSRVCVNSGYLEQWFVPQCQEIVQKYDIDELFLDTMTGFQPCFCSECRQKFGKDIPESDQEETWIEYVQWYHRCYEDFFTRATDAIYEIDPGVAVTFNWGWSYRQPSAPPQNIGRLSGDLIASGVVAEMTSRYYAGTELGFDYMTGRFSHGLGEWNDNTPASLKMTAATTISSGGSFYLIDRQLPEGGLEERGYRMMKEVFSFIQDRRELLENTRPVSELAVLHSYTSLYGNDQRYFPKVDDRKKRLECFEGFTRIMMEYGRHYSVLSDERLAERLHEYKVLILPEVKELAPEALAHIQTWVEAGGRLLVTAPENPESMSAEFYNWAKLKDLGPSPKRCGFYRQTNGDGILFYDSPRLIQTTKDSQNLVPLHHPLAVGEGERYGHGYPPIGEATGHALVTHSSIGRGEVIFIASPFFQKYCYEQNPHHARLILQLLDQLLPEPIVRVKTDARVGLSLMRQGDDLVVHVVNHSGVERLAGYYYPITEYMPEISAIEITLNSSLSPSEAVPSDCLSEKQPSQGPQQSFKLDLHFMSSFRVSGYF